MLNQVVVVGRLTKIEVKGEEKSGVFGIAIPRSYKNENGEYDTDFITFKASGSIAENTAEYCRKGDIIGVKGRVQGNGEDMEIIAERITFLSSKAPEEE